MLKSTSSLLTKAKLRVAIVGLGFGAEFIPIYQRHPHAELAGICQRDAAKLHEVGDKFHVDKKLRFRDFHELLKSNTIDAVHINTPIGSHAAMTIAALEK